MWHAANTLGPSTASTSGYNTAVLSCRAWRAALRRPRHRLSVVAHAFFNAPDVDPPPVMSEKRRMLLSYVQEVQPSIVEHFMDRAPPQVVDAMQHTVSSLLGSLPAPFFTINISTHGEHLAQLLYSVILTGYLMSNAHARLQLNNSLSLPSGDATGMSLFPTEASTSHAPGTQKNAVSGNVILWNNVQGPQPVPAARYIESLEEELSLLRQQLAQHKAFVQQVQAGEQGNALLAYLKGLDADTLEELTACADDDSTEAMNTFIHRLLGTKSADELRRVSSQNSAVELSEILLFGMCVGFLLRALEMKFYLSSVDEWDNDDGLPGLLAGL